MHSGHCVSRVAAFLLERCWEGAGMLDKESRPTLGGCPGGRLVFMWNMTLKGRRLCWSWRNRRSWRKRGSLRGGAAPEPGGRRTDSHLGRRSSKTGPRGQALTSCGQPQCVAQCYEAEPLGMQDGCWMDGRTMGGAAPKAEDVQVGRVTEREAGFQRPRN